jgi:hypothetical protein
MRRGLEVKGVLVIDILKEKEQNLLHLYVKRNVVRALSMGRVGR